MRMAFFVDSVEALLATSPLAIIPNAIGRDVASYVSTTRALAPAQFAAVAIYVAILAAQVPALVARRSIISIVQVTAQLAAVVCDPRVVVSNVAAQAAVTIPSQRRGHAHSYQQETCSNRVFHIFFPPTAIRGY
jgi:hypothetical protein